MSTATGHGPVWMSPPFVTPLKKQLEKLVSKLTYQSVQAESY